MFKWLDNALDFGISEFDFWNMTLAELDRLTQSKVRMQKAKAQEKASYDYILADLVGRSVARLYSSSSKLPDISEVYPTLFDSDEIKQKKIEQQAETSAIRFKQFVDSFNQRFHGGVKDE